MAIPSFPIFTQCSECSGRLTLAKTELQSLWITVIFQQNAICLFKIAFIIETHGQLYDKDAGSCDAFSRVTSFLHEATAAWVAALSFICGISAPNVIS